MIILNTERDGPDLYEFTFNIDEISSQYLSVDKESESSDDAINLQFSWDN